MILLIECIVACLIFGVGIVGSTLHKKTDWLNEYAPAVQKRFLELNPDYVPKTKSAKTWFVVIRKLIACVIFIILLTIMVYLAGARSFWTGFLDTYVIWFVVNLFDIIVLDLGIFMYWKKVRLPGTEDMDQEYKTNTKRSIIAGFHGLAIGIVVALVCGDS